MEQSHDGLARPEKSAQPPAASVNGGAASLPLWRKLAGQPAVVLPLYQRTRTKKNGEIENTMWGPSAVQAIRWLVVLILGGLLIWKAASIPGAAETLLRWLGRLR
jgi:hypothetical protein